MRLDSLLLFYSSIAGVALIFSQHPTFGVDSPGPLSLTHPLLPGVRCSEIWNKDWPRTLHDKQLTGFSPLVCGMKDAPKIWATIDVGGDLNWVKQVKDQQGNDWLLVNDGRIRMVSPEGQVRWTSSEGGSSLFFGNLRGNGEDYLLVGGGSRLSLVEGATGKTEWSHVFQPLYVYVTAAVGEVFPDKPGMEAAVFPQYGEEGYLLNFPPEGEPQFVWKKTVVIPGQHPERYDHGCGTKLDFTVPDKPMIWNLRHHRCFGFDAGTGEMVSSLVYQVGEGHRRNYGPWSFAHDREGRQFLCVVGESIQTHVHAIRLNRNGPSELAWQHYYGEVYEKPGVAVKNITIADVDDDGETEMVYNARDPDQNFRSFVRIRSAATGEVKAELPDARCAAAVSDLGDKAVRALLVYRAPNGATPDRGDLTCYRFEGPGKLRVLSSFRNATVRGPATLAGQHGNDLLLRQRGAKGKNELVRYGLRGDRLLPIARTSAEALLTGSISTILKASDGSPRFLVAGSRGSLECLTWEGKRLWELPLSGGSTPTLSAGDLNGDSRPELVALCAGNRVRAFSLRQPSTMNRQPFFREIANREFSGARGRLSPLLYDLEGNGKLCLIAPGTTDDGKLAVRAYRGVGKLLWETILDMTTGAGGTTVGWNAGQFLPGPHAGVAISVGNSERTREGTYLLDGRTGKILWQKDRHTDGSIVRGVVPVGVPSAFDWDGDGIEEISMDMYSYMAMLRGVDGSFAFLGHTPNIRAAGALYAGLLYNSFCPLYKNPTDRQPYWFVPLGFGSIGLMNPDPTGGIWREELEYDLPDKVGMVDVDGDGRMEVGYSPRNSMTFKCRDLWTGEVEWELKLPNYVYGPVIAADVDGDKKGEFLVGNLCIGTNAEGKGEVRWKAPVTFGWPLIADFDGDGLGEIACAGQGKVYVLKGQSQ